MIFTFLSFVTSVIFAIDFFFSFLGPFPYWHFSKYYEYAWSQIFDTISFLVYFLTKYVLNDLYSNIVPFMNLKQLALNSPIYDVFVKNLKKRSLARVL